ncbi:MZT2B isoform 1 [Pongo abelii]|nr:MZT2B isoform 1 [Pongo abelii]
MASVGARGSPQGAGPSHARVPRHSPVGPIASPASEVEAAIPPRRRNVVIKLRAEPRPAAGREKRFYLLGPLPPKARAQSEGRPGGEGKWRGRSAGGREWSAAECAWVVAASGAPRILVDLLKLNVAPLAVFQMLKSMCAGQRLASEPQDPAAVSLPTSSVPETRGRNKGSAALGGALALAERSSREGSSQRMPRQPSATRLPKGGGPGKSPTRGST